MFPGNSIACIYSSSPGSQCQVIADLAGVSPIRGLTPAACDVCTSRAQPSRAINEVTVSLAIAQPITPEARAALLASHGHCLRREVPPWATQVWSVATAVAGWLATGAHGVPRDVYESRLATCDGCPNRAAHRCRLCGCFVRGKAALPTQRCPIGLWPAVTDEREGVSPPVESLRRPA
jgi:hypothetical protein